MNKIFYKPKNGFVADIIPFSDGKQVYLYYLHDYRKKDIYGEGTPWYLLTSKNFVDYQEQGEILHRGTKDDQDLYVFTGSCIKANDLYHIFYTGHNPHFDGIKPVQAIMHAISTDGIKYQKIDDEIMFAIDGYEMNDWRDPFVFYDQSDEEYKMLLAARKTNHKKRGGVTLMMRSADLKHWSFDREVYFPNLYYTHECPDLFKMGEYYYLIFSEFNQERVTRYVYSKNPYGPWKSFADDRFDGRAFYAAKTVLFEGKRYIFGWNPTKENEHDDNQWQWGGNLVCHEIYNDAEGHLFQKPVDSILKYFDKKIAIDSLSSHTCTTILKKSPNCYYFSFDFSAKKDSKLLLLLNYDDEQDFGYCYEIKKTGFKFDMFPSYEWRFSNFIGCERDVCIKMDENHHLDLFVEDEVVVAYLDNKFALSSRMYQNCGGKLKLYSLNKDIEFKNVEVKVSSK